VLAPSKTAKYNRQYPNKHNKNKYQLIDE